MGRFGERLAAWYLQDKGLEIVATNVAVAGGEIDILALDGGTRVAVEVRTRIGGGDPADAAGARKRDRLRRLSRSVGAQRRDLVAIRLHASGFDVHWIPSL